MAYEMSDMKDMAKPKEPFSPLSPDTSAFLLDSTGFDDSFETYDKPSPPTKLSWKHLFAFTRWRHAGPLSACMSASIVTAGLRAVFAVLLGVGFDVVADFGAGTTSGDDVMRDMSRFCALFAALAAANWLANSASLALWVIFGELQAHSARVDIFGSLLARDMRWFDTLDEGISSLLVQVQTRTRELQLAASQILGQLICDVFASLASLAVAFYFNWRLTLVLLASMPVSMVILWLASRNLDAAIQSQKHHQTLASKHAIASITAIDLVKLFNGADRDLQQYARAVEAAAKHYLVQARCNMIQLGYVSFWVIMMFVAGFWYGVALVDDGAQPGHVLTTFYATLTAFQGVEALMPHLLVLAKGMAAGAFLADIASGVDGTRDGQSTGTLIPPHCLGEIELTKVSFAYPLNPSKLVLKRSSFSFAQGQTTFIVGKSGSGKSTLGYLMSGLYEPSTGEVYIDGRPSWRLDKRWIKRNVTLIQQASVLFDDTIFVNIALGHRSPAKATRRDVCRACESAWLTSTISNLPKGLDTVVGPGGHSLSGGQKQRLALARARLRDPPVLILDEVTSGLDQVTRALVMDSIREWRRDKTTIIITHDVSQIAGDDFVYVMDNANLIEQGLKSDLLGRRDGYFTMLAEAGSRRSSLGHNAGVTATAESQILSPISPGSLSKSQRHFSNDLPRHPSYRTSSIRKKHSSGRSHSVKLGQKEARHSLPLTFHPSLQLDATLTVAKKGDAQKKQVERDVADDRESFSAFIAERFSSYDDGSLAEWDGTSTSRWSSSDAYTLKARVNSMNSLVSHDAARTLNDIGEENVVRLSLGGKDHLQQTGTPTAAVKDQNGKEKAKLVTILSSVWPVLGPRDRLTLVLGLVISFVRGAATPTFSYCLAMLLGALWAPENRMAEGTRWACALIGIALVDGLGTGVGRYLLERAAQAWVDAVRLRALRRVLGQPKAWFDKAEHSPGRINECLDRNSEEMRNILGRFVPVAIYVVVILSVSLVWALVLNWRLTLAALAPVPVIAGAVRGFSYVSGKWEARCNAGAEDSSALLTGIFTNIRVVKSLTLERYFTERYNRSAARTLGLGLRRGAYTSPLFGLYQSMQSAVVALVLYYSTVLLVRERRITAAEMLQIVNLLLFGIGTATTSLNHMPQLTMAQATATQLLRFANLPLRPVEKKEVAQKPGSYLPVRLNNLSFSYTDQAPTDILRSVSFQIEAGRCTAVVGPSGCGKSTLLSILLRLHTPRAADASPLTFNGTPYTDLDPSDLHSAMAYVPQTPFLFPASIADNIAYGLAGATPQAIRRAARDADIHDFIASLPSGYDTLVGDGGQALSGGQAQRVNIARALVRDPQLLVLDEPTSALDAAGAASVRATIHALARGRGPARAIVMVTHSAEMMRVADSIVVLDNGAKVDEGGFDDLVRAGGPFARMMGVDTQEEEERDITSEDRPWW
ncbi:hypothetical protein S40293_06290 [Stachybotrys chartarum IBT 40293]|nr:hypothetical protein S40293_06290 [Stachybotrys chartarum IBT 40293]